MEISNIRVSSVSQYDVAVPTLAEYSALEVSTDALHLMSMSIAVEIMHQSGAGTTVVLSIHAINPKYS